MNNKYKKEEKLMTKKEIIKLLDKEVGLAIIEEDEDNNGNLYISEARLKKARVVLEGDYTLLPSRGRFGKFKRMKMVWKMWRALHDFLELETMAIFDKDREDSLHTKDDNKFVERMLNNPLGFSYFKKEPVSVSRVDLLIRLSTREFWKAVLHDIYDINTKERKIFNEKDGHIKRNIGCQEVIDCLLDDKYKFLEPVGERNGEQLLKITGKGRMFAGSFSVMFRYMREEAGFGLKEIILIVAGMVLATGVFVGKVTIENVWSLACDTINICQK